ncbi:GtrA family protein [Pseudactinotalea terrae]|uniref:GtrA family protein n=1 Tax=Pseudactinotalea terrae TaxID=1743262 RepID=UPI0012E101BC|nr:GtrA family protein [Pseudactinotalea terrae]
MERLRHWLLVRHRSNWIQLFRFALVGGSGVLVNLLVMVICKKMGAHPEAIAVDLPGTDFNVRWYHVFSTIAFLVANLWNFQLNRWWTFRSAKQVGWWREYPPFLVVGSAAQVVGLGILTLLMHPHSPLGLPSEIFDDTTGLRTKVYWAQLISVILVTPVSFVLNKIWTFRRVRTRDGRSLATAAHLDPEPAPPRGAADSSENEPQRT